MDTKPRSSSLLLPLHAPFQVMGILQGKVVGDTFIVIDSFALPVEGTETRVNAQVRGHVRAGGCVHACIGVGVRLRACMRVGLCL